MKISKFYFGPGSPKTDFYDFSRFFYEKQPGNPETVAGTWNLE